MSMQPPPSPPTDDRLAAWLSGDLGTAADEAVAQAVRTDPAVARRADELAAALVRLAAAAAPPTPVGLVDEVRAGVAAALRDEGGAGGPTSATAVLAEAAARPRAARPRGRRPRRESGSGRRRLDRALSGLVVLLVVAVGSTVAVRSFREGGPLPLPQPTTAPPLTDVQDPMDPESPVPDQLANGPEASPRPTAGADGSEQGSGGDLGGTPTNEDSSDATDQDPGGAGPVGDGPGGSGPDGSGPGAGGSGDDGPAAGDAPGDASAGAGTEDDAPAPLPSGQTEAPAGDGQGGGPDPGDPDASLVTEPDGQTPEGAEQPTEGDDAGSGGGGGDGEESAAEDPATPEAPAADGQGGGPDPGDDTGDASPEDVAGPSGPEEDATTEAAATSPTVRDSVVDLPDDEAVRTHFGNRAEAAQLIGLSGQDARDRGTAHAEAVAEAAPFASGSHPADCLHIALAGSGTSVVAAVESAVYQGTAALAHLVVSGEETLDRATAVVTDLSSCTILTSVSVPA